MDAKEQFKMVELLKWFKGLNVAETDLEEGGEEEDALFQSLRGVDICTKPHPGLTFLIVVLALNSVSPNDLWKLLPEEKEVKFIKATGDPSSELARQLLADNGKQFKPWWKGGEYLLIERPSAMNDPRCHG